MKYQPTFDQVACLDFGFTCVDGMLIDLIITAPTWAKKVVVDEKEYYLLAQTKIMSELPCAFGSTQAVNRAVKRIRGVLEIHQQGRSNYYRVAPELAMYWGRKDKGDEYYEYVAEHLRKRRCSESEIPPEAEVNTSGSGGVPKKIPPKAEAIKQPINQPTNIQQPRAREVGVEIPASLSDDVVVVCNLVKKIDPGIRQTVVNELGDKVVQGKVHGSVGAYLAGVIKKIKQNGYSKPKGPRPKWANIPDDDNKLMRWAKAHGYDKPKRGELSGPYRRRLSDQVAARWRGQAGEGAAYA